MAKTKLFYLEPEIHKTQVMTHQLYTYRCSKVLLPATPLLGIPHFIFRKEEIAQERTVLKTETFINPHK